MKLNLKGRLVIEKTHCVYFFHPIDMVHHYKPSLLRKQN